MNQKSTAPRCQQLLDEMIQRVQAPDWKRKTVPFPEPITLDPATWREFQREVNRLTEHGLTREQAQDALINVAVIYILKGNPAVSGKAKK